MKVNKNIAKAAVVAALAMVFIGCKPTEKNYREAYDVAIAKKQQSEDELAKDGLVSADAPKMRIVQGDTIYFKNALLQIKMDASIKEFNVVVDEFKMQTNAKSGAALLKEKGYDSFAVKSTGGRWFVVAGSVNNLDEARAIIKRFRKDFPSYPYIGVGKPVIIQY